MTCAGSDGSEEFIDSNSVLRGSRRMMKEAGDVRGEETSQKVLKQKLLHQKTFKKVHTNFKPTKMKIHKDVSP